MKLLLVVLGGASGVFLARQLFPQNDADPSATSILPVAAFGAAGAMIGGVIGDLDKKKR